MIIVRLSGGMGNQMFQYALGRSLAIKNNVPLGLDLTYLLDRTPMPSYFTYRDYQLDMFNVQAIIVSRKDIPLLYRKYNFGVFMRYIDYIRRKFIPTPGKEKRDYYFDLKISTLGPNAYLEGWWQTPKYFADIEDIIRKDFTLKNIPSENIGKLAEEISSKNSLCVHIRRGDYVGNKNHEVVNATYYTDAITYILQRTNIDKVYVFSDDIEWCKNNISFKISTFFVDDSFAGYKDEGNMFLMSACKHFIIPNSSFSWWAAWLANSPDKIVVAPRQWVTDLSKDTADIIPKSWIRM